MPKRVGNWIAALLLLVLVVVVFVSSAGLPTTGQESDPGPVFYPRMIAVALGLLSLGLLLQSSTGEALPRGRDAARVVAIIVLLVLYAYILQALGFIAATILFLVGGLLAAGIRGPLALVLLPAGVSVVTFYVFFELLQVSLPQGVLEGLLF